MEKKTLLFVFGTRPEFIKMLPLILKAKKHPNVNAIVCSTGQHKEMLESLYQFFNFRPDIDFRLMKPNQTLTTLHAETMNCMEIVLDQYKPDWVIVQGDTTSAHAAAMSAFYHKAAVAHVEAGLRTYDINSPFPEEMNRRAIGMVTKAHLCPTVEAAMNLKGEPMDKTSFIEITGNTGIDTLNIVAEEIEKSSVLKSSYADQFHFLNNEDFILATMHRRENFGQAHRDILRAFLQVIKSRPINILLPVHPNPNVRKSVDDIFQDEVGKSVFWLHKKDIKIPKDKTSKIFLVDPLDYPALVYAMKESKFVVTDSGGLQEEAPTFGKKILVLRESTERPEGVTAGFSQLVGSDYERIVRESCKLIDEKKHWKQDVPLNPYGDGNSSHRIMKILLDDKDFGVSREMEEHLERQPAELHAVH